MGTLGRSFQISRIVIKYTLLNRHDTLGVRLRLACQELGLVFIKIGQILSTRYELLSQEDCKELQKLLDIVDPFPYEKVKEIFLKDFNALPESIFMGWNPIPLASASIAQVYKAYLPGHGEVAVKVKRPDIEKNVTTDLKILKRLGKIAQIFSADLRHIKLDEVFSQIESWLLAEVDFKNEAKNLNQTVTSYYEKMRKTIGECVDTIVFPKIYPDFCSNQIITMEFIEGVPVREFKKIENNPRYDAQKSLKSSMGAIMRMWINGDEFVFHGDPHPSNLLILPNGKMAFLDLGLLGCLNKRDTKETRDLLLAVYAQDVDATILRSLKMCGVPHEKYASKIKEDIKKYLETTKNSPMGFWFTGLAKVLIKNRIPFPYQIVLIGRMQAIIEGLFETVTPGITTVEVFGDELKRGLRKQILNNLLEVDFGSVIYALSEQVKKSPKLIAGVIDTYFNNPVQAIKDIKKILQFG